MTTLKLTAVGTSTGLVIPKDLLAKLKVAKGDSLYAVETLEGLLLTPYDPAIKDQLEIGQAFMKRYRDSFNVLAK